MVPSGMLSCVALVRTDVSEELSAFFIGVTRISELGTTLAVTNGCWAKISYGSWRAIPTKNLGSGCVSDKFIP
jgi:hypothetical protein